MTGPSHRAPKAGRRTSRTTLVAAAFLAVGMAVALVATVRLAGSDGGSAATDLSERVAAKSSPSTSPSASESESGAAVSRSAPTTAPVQKVLQAAVIKPKPPKVLERERVERIAAQQAELDTPFSFTIGTFNVLGSQHTAPGGDRRRYPPASVRTPGAAGLVAAHGLDILGAQELQADQLADLSSRTGLTAWPGTAWGSEETDNSILFDDSRFDYVEGTSFSIPFMGRPRPSPVLKLKDSATGREFYVVNTHLSAGGGRYAAERRSGMATLVAKMNELKATGLPVLLTGDMNDREAFYCGVVGPAALSASNGGGAGCAPPGGQIPVDWVVGSGITWSGYWRDTSSTSRRISDHIFVSATAHVG